MIDTLIILAFLTGMAYCWGRAPKRGLRFAAEMNRDMRAMLDQAIGTPPSAMAAPGAYANTATAIALECRRDYHGVSK